MKPLPLHSDDGSPGPMTQTLGDMYDAIAYLLNEKKFSRDTPVGVYTPVGAAGITGWAVVHPPEEAPTAVPMAEFVPGPKHFLMLAGQQLPYGVAVHRRDETEIPDQTAVHTEYPSRPTLIDLNKEVGP